MTTDFPMIPTHSGIRLGLGSIVTNSPVFKKKNIDKWSRLRVQHRFLGGSKPIHTGMGNCRTHAQFVRNANKGQTVTWTVQESGKQNFYGLNTCLSKDCSICGLTERGKFSDNLEMACLENLLSGGQGSFVTATMKSGQSPKQIEILLDATKMWAKKIADYNSDHGTKISYVIARECTFSPNKPTQNQSHRFFYHAHAHGLFIFPREDVARMAHFHKLLEGWWVKSVEKIAAGKILILSGKNKGTYKAGKYMFQVKETNPDKLISKYIAKHLTPSLEISYGNIKEGRTSSGGHKGRSLEELKASIILSDCPHEQGMFCNYIKAMKNQKRFLRSKKRIDEAVDRWKQYRYSQYNDAHLRISISEWLEIQGHSRSSHVSDSLLKVLIGDSAFLPFEKKFRSKKLLLEMDHHLSNEFFGLPDFNITTANQAELVIARTHFVSKCRNFLYYMKKMECDKSREFSLLLGASEDASRQQMLIEKDPVRFTLNIPAPLWNHLSSQKIIFPLLECVRRHVICEAHFPRLKFIFEYICSGNEIPVKGVLTRFLPTTEITGGHKEAIREVIAWALEEDYRHASSYIEMIECMYEDQLSNKLLPTRALLSKWEHMRTSFKKSITAEIEGTLGEVFSVYPITPVTNPDWIEKLLQ